MKARQNVQAGDNLGAGAVLQSRLETGAKGSAGRETRTQQGVGKSALNKAGTFS